MPRSKVPTWWRLLPVFILTLLVFQTWRDPARRSWFDGDYWAQWLRVGEVMRIGHLAYVNPSEAEYEALADEALAHIFNDLDRYSAYLPADSYQEFSDESEQRYVGIGVEIERLQQRITITSVFAGSPATEAGLQPGDRIIGVDGTDTRHFTLSQIVEVLRGEPGSRAQVTIQREHLREPLEFELERRTVHFPRVRDIAQLAPGIGYLHVTQFGSQTEEEFAKACQKLVREGCQALIIDLRGNPGGLLNEAVALVDHFLPPDTLVVSTQGRNASPREDRTRQQASYPTLPLAVLIDGNSASASEIVAGALQTHQRAVLVGETTFGKASVQSIYRLRDGGGLRLTTARYYLPDGRSIHEQGVTPDIQIPLSETERTINWALRGHTGLDDEAFARQFGFPRPADRQRDAALSLLQGILLAREAS